MSRGKYLSLEEARKRGKLDCFAKEHPSETDQHRFERLLEAMSQGVLEGEETSSREHDGSSNEIRTRRDT